VDGMLQGFLDRSRASRLTFTNVAAEDVIESCLVLARPVAARVGVELVVCLPADPPHIIADELSLKQILLNLLANAITFSRQGERGGVWGAPPAGGVLQFRGGDRGRGRADPRGAGQQPAESIGGGPNRGLGFGLPLAKARAQANGARLQ